MAAALVSVVIVWGLFSICWIWFLILRPLRLSSGRPLPLWSLYALQISIMTVILGLLIVGPIWALAAGAFPPTALLFLFIAPSIPSFVLTPIWFGISLAVSAFAFTHFVLKLRSSAFPISCLLFFIVFVATGEQKSRAVMCKAAAALGVESFARNSFLWSLGNSGKEYQWSVHALLSHENQHLAWSYGEQAFFVLNNDTWPNVSSGTPHQCS